MRIPNGPERRKDLDGLRGLAVALTILLHYVSRSGFFPHLGPPHLAQILDSAWAGVDIFFVLSGFLIGGIILDHGSSDAFFRVFYLRRALRILPVALLTIGFSYLVLPLLNPSILWPAHVPLYAYLLFINHFWTALGYQSYAPLGPMWSLAIEEQFYLLAPALLVSCKPRIRNVFLLAVVLISPLLRYWHPGFSGWDFTLFRLDGFALGILLAALTRDPLCMAIASNNRRTITALAVSLSAAALLFASTLTYTPSERVAFGVSFNSLATAGVILLLHVAPDSLLSGALSRPWLVTLGKYSYFLYLMHMPLLFYTLAAFGGRPNAVYVAVAFVITIGGAWGSWKFLESPVTSIGRRHHYSDPETQRGSNLLGIIR